MLRRRIFRLSGERKQWQAADMKRTRDRAAHSNLAELAKLFFATRQLIRSKLPHGGDANSWIRSEVLRFVRDSEPAPTMREIADYARIKAPSATSLVQLLQKLCFVCTAKSGRDRRVIRIELTAKGKRELYAY